MLRFACDMLFMQNPVFKKIFVPPFKFPSSAAINFQRLTPHAVRSNTLSPVLNHKTQKTLHSPSLSSLFDQLLPAFSTTNQKTFSHRSTSKTLAGINLERFSLFLVLHCSNKPSCSFSLKPKPRNSQRIHGAFRHCWSKLFRRTLCPSHWSDLRRFRRSIGLRPGTSRYRV